MDFLYMSPQRVHRWGVPVAHALLWITGLILSVNCSNWIDSRATQVFGLFCVFVVFMMELSISYFDLPFHNEIGSWRKLSILHGLAMLLVAMAVVFIFVYVYQMFILNHPIIDFLWLFIISTAGLKFLEIWLPNSVSEMDESEDAGALSETKTLLPKKLI